MKQQLYPTQYDEKTVMLFEHWVGQELITADVDVFFSNDNALDVSYEVISPAISNANLEETALLTIEQFYTIIGEDGLRKLLTKVEQTACEAAQ